MVYRFLTIVRRNLVLVETCQWMGRPIVSSLLVFVVNVFFVFMSQSKSANKRSLVETDFRSGMRNERWTKRLVNTFSTCVCDVIVTWPAQSSQFCGSAPAAQFHCCHTGCTVKVANMAVSTEVTSACSATPRRGNRDGAKHGSQHVITDWACPVFGLRLHGACATSRTTESLYCTNVNNRSVFWSSQNSILGLSIERLNASVHFSVTILSLLGTWHDCQNMIPSYCLETSTNSKSLSIKC